MSIYDEAILIQKPSGYKAEKLYNVIPSPQVSEQSSVEFDGVDDYLAVDDITFSAGQTISMWINPTELDNYRSLFGKDATSSYVRLISGSEDKGFEGETDTNGDFFTLQSSNVVFVEGEWTHLVLVWNDDQTWTMYCDGIEEATSSATTDNTMTISYFGVGYSSSPFYGKMSDVAIFSRELNQSDVKEIYNYGSPNDLLLPASYGTDISQSSTKSVEFDGVDDYLDCGDDSTLDITTAITCSVWVNCESVPSVSGFVICKDDDNVNQSFQLNVQSSVINWRIYDGGTAYTSAYSINIVDSNWHHLVGTYDGLNVKLYVDGVLQATQSHSGDIDAASGENVFIGKRGDGSRFFNGSIDNVGIYDKALTQAEVTRQYNGGQPIDLSTDATSDSLVAYYQMGDGTLDEYPLIADQTDATLGSEEMVNGDLTDNPFATPSYTNGWSDSSIGTSVAVWNSGNNTIELVGDGSGSNRGNATTRISCIANKTYKLDYNELTTPANAAIRVNSTGAWSDSSTAYFDANHYTAPFYFTSNVTGYVYIVFSVYDAVQWEIGSVSVKQVQGNPAIMTNMSSSDITTDVALSVVNDLESYYQMGDGILDEYPLIADQTDTTLGSEVVVNGDFEDGSTDWILGTGWTISDGKAISTGSEILSQIFNHNNKIYQYSFEVSNYVSGNLRFRIGNGATERVVSANGVYTGTMQGAGGQHKIIFGDTGIPISCSVDNVSVKEIQGNPAVMTNMSSADIVAWTPNIETDFDVARSSWTTRRNASGYIEQVAPNVPRLNYDSGVVCPYLLTEAAGTNLLTYPVSFGNPYWTKVGSSIHSSTDYDGSAVSTEAMTSNDGIYNIIVRSTWTQVNDATTGNELCTKMVVDSSAAQTHYGRDGYSSGFVSNGVGYSITADVYIPSSNSLVDGIGFGWHDYNSDTMPLISTTADGDTQISADTWTTITTKTIMANLSTTFDFTLALVDGTDNFFDGNSSDYACVKNVVITPLKPFEAPKVLPVANSEELVTNGNFEDGSTDWTLQAGWSIVGEKARYDSTVSGFTIRQLMPSIAVGKTIKLQFDISDIEVGKDAFLKIEISGTPEILLNYTLLNQGTHTYYHTITSGLDRVTFVAINSSTGGAFSIDNISVKEVTSYSGGGFEREAYKFVEDTSNGQHYIKSSGFSGSVGEYYSFSVYAKAGERDYMYLGSQYSTPFSGGMNAYFNLSDGTIGTVVGSTSASITSMSNGWYRCSISAVCTATNNTQFRIYTSDGDVGDSYQGDGESGVYIAYAQFEESDYASSLMLPVSEGSTTSRVADEVSNAGNQSLFSGVNSSGVLYAEIAALSNDGTDREISLSDGTNSNKVVIKYHSTSNGFQARVVLIGVSQCILSGAVTDVTDFSKVAIRWAVNDFSLWIDGIEVATDVSGSIFPTTTLTTVNFDRGDGNNDFYGKTNALAVFDYLSDDQMVKLTEEGYDTFNALATANNFIIR